MKKIFDNKKSPKLSLIKTLVKDKQNKKYLVFVLIPY